MHSANIFHLIKSSIFSGLCIAVAGTVFLSTKGIIGSILFSFGLLAITHYKTPLYTGKSGFVENKKDFYELPIILIGNIIGTIIVALLIKISNPIIISEATKIVASRISIGYGKIFIMSIFCGFIMTIIVKHAKEQKYLPLLFGIPVFIMSGFIHSIADAFYYSLASFDFITNNLLTCILIYLTSVIGNFIGCNIPRTVV